MRLRMRSSPACNDRCRCGISRASLASASSRSASASTESIDDSRSRASSGTSRRICFTSVPSRGAPAGRAIAGDVDAGQHDLAIAALGEPAHLRHHLVHRHRARIAAAERNDAEGAAVVAAVLHLHEGARAAVDAVDRDAARMPRTAMMSVTATFSSSRRAQARASSFSSLPMTRSTSAMAANVFRLGLRRAAGDDDARVRPFALEPADRSGAPGARLPPSPRRC